MKNPLTPTGIELAAFRFVGQHLNHFATAVPELAGDSRKMCNEDLYDLYSSPNIFRMNKSRRMRWAVHVARMGERRVAYRILVGKQ